MEHCSYQCLRRTFYAVTIGVSPIVFCLIFIGLARCILYRLEIAYYRRLKPTDRRISSSSYKSGRLILSYTPVSKAELQRVIQGEYQTRPANDTRRTPRFIKSILPRREPAMRSTNILANLVIRRDAIDAHAMADMITPIDIPLQPTFSIVNEQNKRRPSLITVQHESIETTTLTPQTVTIIKNTSKTDDNEYESPMTNDVLMPKTATTTTKTLTTTVVVEEFLEFHSVSSLPCELTVLNTVVENENEPNSEINSLLND